MRCADAIASEFPAFVVAQELLFLIRQLAVADHLHSPISVIGSRSLATASLVVRRYRLGVAVAAAETQELDDDDRGLIVITGLRRQRRLLGGSCRAVGRQRATDVRRRDRGNTGRRALHLDVGGV